MSTYRMKLDPPTLRAMLTEIFETRHPGTQVTDVTLHEPGQPDRPGYPVEPGYIEIQYVYKGEEEGNAPLSPRATVALASLEKLGVGTSIPISQVVANELKKRGFVRSAHEHSGLYFITDAGRTWVRENVNEAG